MFTVQLSIVINSGGRGIRTPGTVPRTAVFKTAGFNHSPIPPSPRIPELLPLLNHRLVQDGGVSFGGDGWVGAGLLGLLDVEFGFGKGAVGAVAGTFRINAGAGHEFLDRIDRFVPVV